MNARAVLVASLMLSAGCVPAGGSGNDRPTLRTTRSAVGGCADRPPPVFQAGLCVCEDFEAVGDLIVRGAAPGEQALAGVNGQTDLVGEPRIEGSMVAWGGLDAVGESSFTGSLSTTTTVDGVGRLSVGGDLVVGGDLTGVGELQVGGNVCVGGTFKAVGASAIGGLCPYQEPALPCACGADEVVDVAALVAQAREHRDNERVGLPKELDLIGEVNLELDTGRYFFDRVKTVGNTTITVLGNVSIYLEGNLDEVGDQTFRLAPDATLDLYVSGNVEVVGDTSFGGDPGRFRLYVGGQAPVAVAVGDQQLRGSLYAPRAEVTFVGDTLVEGALFARQLTGVGTLEIAQAGSVAPTDPVCPPEASEETEGGSGGSSDGGAPGAGGGGPQGSGSSDGGARDGGSIPLIN